MNKDKDFELTEEEKEEQKGFMNVKKASAMVVVLSLIAFVIIVYFTDLIGSHFGKSFENIALGVVALGLIIAWYFNDKTKDKK